MSQAPTDPIDRASAWTRSLGITRPSDEAWFAGVCAGIARRFNVDPILIRAGAVALAMLGGFGVVAYLALWLALPGSDSRILGEEAVRRGNVSGVLLLILLFLVLVGGLGWSADGGWRLWLVIPLGYLAYRILRRDGQTPPPLSPPPPPPPPPPGGAMCRPPPPHPQELLLWQHPP
jgi:phage shock protein PspC (stress-responsive transcriptional regulator)